MEKYENEEYLRKEIMEQDRHLFIYGYNNEHRSDFLKSLEYNYPFLIDTDKPIALYFDSLGFPKMDIDLKNKNINLIEVASMEYLSFTIATKILEKAMQLEIDLEKRLARLIYLTNVNRNDNYKEVKNVKDLLKELKISRDFYYEKYISYVKGVIEEIPINDIAVPFIQLEMFIKEIKTALNINSYFGIIIDKKGPLATTSVQAINTLIGGRINDDISVKVAISQDDWETYITNNGQFIEAIHDYGTVELDDSYKKYMNLLTRKL